MNANRELSNRTPSFCWGKTGYFKFLIRRALSENDSHACEHPKPELQNKIKRLVFAFGVYR
ncbi:hypothetical protein L228DRAFT_94102 [Xylona heveae TC161]|uniref:Uncharacterized protein n=1 Tax=Xylona heveae (strain CBS 132557 / TC161) TaxID=1328760 RepID=A0A165I356_XYLHT|nr:hypothetical protein L228DRAFT_94102 [Xylona heveae TC161]KZF24308.1 hypothetical protein L228DRAFT_94102 [Xylona heveae TC161]